MAQFDRPAREKLDKLEPVQSSGLDHLPPRGGERNLAKINEHAPFASVVTPAVNGLDSAHAPSGPCPDRGVADRTHVQPSDANTRACKASCMDNENQKPFAHLQDLTFDVEADEHGVRVHVHGGLHNSVEGLEDLIALVQKLRGAV